MRSVLRISLFNKRSDMIRRTIIVIMCMATFFSVRTVARSGEIAPELLKELESSGITYEHSVIIKMRAAIDQRALRTSAEHVARWERVKKVEQELRTGTELSQQSLLDHLEPQRKLGR